MIHLGPLDVLVATGLVLLAGGISLALRLGIERRLAWVSLRTVVQLGLLGLVLEKVFAIRHPALVLGMLLLMTGFAAREAVARSSRRYPWIHLDAWLAIAVAAFVVGGIVTQVVVGARPWYSPRYVIPLVGMILGNSLTGISLCLDRFLEHLDARRGEIELRLAFGATRREALADAMRASVRTGLVPIMNAMAAAGVVSLPGMMTGQIVAGAPPLQAVAYQVVVMFMLAAAGALGAMIAAVLVVLRRTRPDGSLRRDHARIRRRPRA